MLLSQRSYVKVLPGFYKSRVRGLQKPCRGVVMSNLYIKFKSSASGNTCDLSVSGKIDGFYEVSYVGSESMFQLFVIPLLVELIDK